MVLPSGSCPHGSRSSSGQRNCEFVWAGPDWLPEWKSKLSFAQLRFRKHCTALQLPMITTDSSTSSTRPATFFQPVASESSCKWSRTKTVASSTRSPDHTWNLLALEPFLAYCSRREKQSTPVAFDRNCCTCCWTLKNCYTQELLSQLNCLCHPVQSRRQTSWSTFSRSARWSSAFRCSAMWTGMSFRATILMLPILGQRAKTNLWDLCQKGESLSLPH